MAEIRIPLPVFPQLGGSYLFPYIGLDVLRNPAVLGLRDTDKRSRHRLLLVCAGECVDDAQECVPGQRDSALTARGRQQAQAAGRELRRILDETCGLQAIYCSKLKRGKETADILCKAAGINIHGVDNDLDLRQTAALNERNVRSVFTASKKLNLICAQWGFLEGRPLNRLREEYGNALVDLFNESMTIPPVGGQSLGSLLHTRVVPFLNQMLLPSISGRHTRTAIVVGHPDSLRAVLLALNGKRSPGAIREALMSPGSVRSVAIDRRGNFVAYQHITVPVIPRDGHSDSLESHTSDATGISSEIATPPTFETEGRLIGLKKAVSDVPRLDFIAEPLQITFSDAVRKTTILDDDHEPFFDAPQSPLVSNPLTWSQFADRASRSHDERIYVPGRRESFLMLTSDVARLSAAHCI